MRTALVSMGVIAFALAGSAHAVECYASEWDDKIGDVSMTYEFDEAGKEIRNVLSWTVERTDGTESQFYARPGLMLDFKLDEAGALSGPTNAEMTVSRVSTGGRAAPPMSELKVKATTVGDPLVWDWSSQSKGQGQLAKHLGEAKPPTLKLELLDKADKLMASSNYNLAAMDKVQAMAVKAKAAADKRVAAFQAEVAKGTVPKSCPAG